MGRKGKIPSVPCLLMILPVLILIGGALHALGLEAVHQPVQGGLAEPLKPGGSAEPADQGGADGVVEPDEGPSGRGGGQLAVPEAAEGPDLGTVVGAIHRRGHITAALFLHGLGDVILVVVLWAGGHSLLDGGLFLLFQVLNEPQLGVQGLTAGAAENLGIIIGKTAGGTAF